MSHLREVMDQHWLVRNQQQIKNTSIIWLTLLCSYDPKIKKIMKCKRLQPIIRGWSLLCKSSEMN